MMLFKSRIKWIVLLVLMLSTGSLVVHLSITKFSATNLVQFTPVPALRLDFPSSPGSKRVITVRNKKLWGPVKPLESLQPYANPRITYPAPSENNNGYIYAKLYGGFSKIRSSICDLVTISRLLNATLVIPEIQDSLRSKGISNKFKSFSYLYDEDQFIASLKNDVRIVKSLPANLRAARKRNEFPIFKPKISATISFYIKEILPKLRKSKVIGLILADGGCVQSVLPPSMAEFQRLRCRVGFHALQFRQDLKVLGHRIVERLVSSLFPFPVLHHQDDVHSELIQYRRAQLIKRGMLTDKLSVDSHIRRDNGSCPLMPEEVGLLLRAMGYRPNTIIYVAGSETFGGQRLLIPLRAMFSNLVDYTSFCSKQELSDLLGPETLLPPNPFKVPAAKSDAQLKEEWKRAGPRPRPLPPPPDRPIYQHEKEGWYGWITETDTEPEPSPADLRMQAHRLLWDALDYIVSLEADTFFPGFNNDGSRWPDFSSLVMGQRLYESPASRTVRPDRQACHNLDPSNLQNLPACLISYNASEGSWFYCMMPRYTRGHKIMKLKRIIQESFKLIRDDMYHPKYNWTISVREHLNKSFGVDGVARQSQLSKPASFLSHPFPECSCRMPSSVGVPTMLKDKQGRVVFGGEDECPKWMQSNQESAVVESGAAAEGGSNEDAESEYENEFVETQDLDASKSSLTLAIDQDDEWDPND
ncbi:Protein EMBRYO SAC DEVELOPMENT ARREST 30 [Linum perenne]